MDIVRLSYFLLIIMFIGACVVAKPNLAARNAPPVRDNAQLTADHIKDSMRLDSLYANVVYLPKNQWQVDSTGALKPIGIMMLDSLVIRSGWLYVGNPDKRDTVRGNGADTLVFDTSHRGYSWHGGVLLSDSLFHLQKPNGYVSITPSDIYLNMHNDTADWISACNCGPFKPNKMRKIKSKK